MMRDNPSKENIKDQLERLIEAMTEMKESVSNGIHDYDNLKESERIFRTIFEYASEGIFLADTKSKKILMGNRQAYKDLGYSPDEIKGLEIKHIHPEKDIPYVFDQFEKLIRNEITTSRNIPVKRKDGSIYFADISALSIPLIGRSLMIGIFRDVTDRKQAEDAMNEKNQFIASLLRAVPVAVFYKDKDGKYLGCNDMFTEIMGLTTDQIRGKTVQELWPSELAEKYHKMDLELMRNREHQVYEYKMKAKDGQMHPVIYAKDVFLDKEGEVAGLVGAFLDISESKKVVQEREHLASELKDALVEIKILSGLLPICSYCKKIRDDKGYWNQMESYISSRSNAVFSHCICPECLKKQPSKLEV